MARISLSRLLVNDDPKVRVDMEKMTPAQMMTGTHHRKVCNRVSCPALGDGLLEAIVGGLLGDDDVVHVALAQSGG